MMTGQIYKRDMDQALGPLGLLEQKKRLSNPHIKLPQSYLKQNVTLPLNQHLPPPSLKFLEGGGRVLISESVAMLRNEKGLDQVMLEIL